MTAKMVPFQREIPDAAGVERRTGEHHPDQADGKQKGRKQRIPRTQINRAAHADENSGKQRFAIFQPDLPLFL